MLYSQNRERAKAGWFSNSFSGNAFDRSSKSRLAMWVTSAFLVESYLAKSFIFAGNDPTTLHYAVSIVLSVGMFLLFCLDSNAYRGRFFLLFIAGGAIAWTLISSYQTGYALNYIASVTFGFLILSCFFWFPYVCYRAGVETWRLLLVVLGIPASASLPMFLALPDMALDTLSGRLAGTFISVAVACNVFFYVSVLAAFALKLTNKRKFQILYLSVCLISLICLYFTRTRSSLLEAFVCIFIVCVTSAHGKIIFRRLFASIAFVAILVFAIALGVLTLDFDLNSEISGFRLENGITSSRNDNWAFGVERIVKQPLFGEGMLTKQTQGGQAQVNLEASDNYNAIYDPHSLVLSLGVQGGMPLLLAVMFLIFSPLIAIFRIRGPSGVLGSPEFVLSSVHLCTMIPAGGDLTSFGNSVDRIFWILLGALSLQAAQHTSRQQALKGGSPSLRRHMAAWRTRTG